MNIALGLHDKIFGYNEKYSDEKLWIKNLKHGKIYLVDNKGFLFVYKKDKYIHIWLCGVLPKYRKQGIFTKLIDEFKEDPYFSGEIVTISTIPNKFPEMYNWIMGKGFDLIKIENGKYIFQITKSKL
jgi:ribosomal protein S18 acetylase RimI-like enzyme